MRKSVGRLMVVLAFVLCASMANAELMVFDPSDQGYITRTKGDVLSDVFRADDLLVGRLDEAGVTDSDVVESVGVFKFDLRSLQSDWIINWSEFCLKYVLAISSGLPFSGP